MSREDLTRWNRSGLRRLRYVDGNVATYLEEIRSVLAGAFPDKWHSRLQAPFDEDALRKEMQGDERWVKDAINNHLIAQYLAERGDLAWELVRAFVRSCHVLTEHIDAHANETFLRTATQWDNLRKLVATLNYHPVGATSATTYLAFEAKGRGTVPKGLQVRHRPASGDRPVVFETLEDLVVDERFNVLTVVGADRSTTVFKDRPEPLTTRWKMLPKAPVSIGEAAILFEDDSYQNGEAAWVIGRNGNEIQLDHEGDAWMNFIEGQARLKSSPRFKRKPWINGEDVRRTTRPHHMSAGSVLAWRKQKEPTATQENPWAYAEVDRADAYGLALRLPPFGVDKGDSFSAEWCAWDTGDIEIRPATRLTGSYTVPAEEDIDHEVFAKGLARLADFTMGEAFSTVADPVDPPSPGKTDFLDFRGTRVASKSPPPLPSGSLEEFIFWLFKVLGFAGSFPLTPDILVNIGAMIKTKDARIPSTGQLVFEAFLDLFGGGGSDATTDFGEGGPPALFRFWVDADVDPKKWRETYPDRPPFGADISGELWYLSKKPVGGGDADPDLVDPNVLLARNHKDDGWVFLGGRPSGLVPGDWVAARFGPQPDDPKWYAAEIVAIKDSLDSQDDQGPVVPDPPDRYHHPSACAVKLEFRPESIDELVSGPPIPELLEIQGDFRGTTEHIGADINKSDLTGPIHVKPCPGHEAVGRTMVAVNNAGAVQKVRVEKADDCHLTLSPALDPEFKQGNLMLLGNVVRTGHGERRPVVQMGGGSGAERDDYLVIPDLEVSTLPDSSLAHGAREDLDVRIDGARWHPVPRLDNSDPADRNYTVTTTQEGYLKLQFGDGVHGRRVPAGTNNVRISYRVGAGARGDLPPGSLEKLVSPHPLVTAVRQPFESVGGSDMERPEQMRDRAPASMLALGRAVSKGDFEQLAMQHRSVAQAVATYHIGGADRRDLVEVVVASSAGPAFDDTTREELAAYLQRRAVPTVRVTVTNYNSFVVGIGIDVYIDYRTFQPHEVRLAVRKAVASRFSVEQRPIGQSLYLSEVYALVESLPGLEHSTCRFEAIPDAPKDQGEYGSIADDRVDVARTAIGYVPDEAAVNCTPYEYTP